MNNCTNNMRSSNFELLRIILIIFVIILHYNGIKEGPLALVENSTNIKQIFVYLMESFSICAVNTFILLSGYFLSHRTYFSYRKVVDLFLIAISYSIFLYLIKAFISHSFSNKAFIGLFVPTQYYIWFYCTLFLLAPFLNLIILNLEGRKLDLFILTLLILFSLIPTIFDFISYKFNFSVEHRSTISMLGNGHGFTIINFILMYFLGGYVARKKISNVVGNVIGYLICSFVTFLGMVFNRKHALDYCNLFVVFQSVFLFLIFQNMKFNNTFVNFISKSIWGIFWIHPIIIPFWNKILPIGRYNTKSIHFICYYLCLILIVFFSSLIIEKIFSYIIRPIFMLFDKLCILNMKIDISGK